MVSKLTNTNAITDKVHATSGTWLPANVAILATVLKARHPAPKLIQRRILRCRVCSFVRPITPESEARN